VNSESLELAKTAYQQGQSSFERGDYRQAVQSLEQSLAALDPGSKLGGEIQIWLVMAYEAAGMRTEAIALGQKISQHPHYEIRLQSKRLLYILEAPKLKTNPEWLTQIPDLSNVSDQGENKWGTSKFTPTVAPKPPAEPAKFTLLDPVDPSQVKTQDHLLFWLALGLAILVIGALVGLS
jgi:tetratricopeptide (TPR) repeat protein